MSTARNVLLIISDQFRHECLGAAGNPIIQTPNLDALAAEGVLFTHHFAQTCPCGPSRMCLYTGRYMCSTRSVNNQTPLTDAEDNVARFLRDAGCDAGILGYNDYALDPRICAPGDPRRTSLNYDNFLPGFDVLLDHEHDSPEYFAYLRERGYPPELCTRRIVHEPDVPPEGTGGHLPCHFPARYRAEDSEGQFISTKTIEYFEQAHDRPWFLSVNYIKPHSPHICPAPYHAMYDPAAMPSANRRPEELEDPHPYWRLMRPHRALVEEGPLREIQAAYYGMVSEVDACVGSIVQALKDTGLWDKTLTVFTSDHGEYLGDHYCMDKAHYYDETMRVPCIVRDPSPEADATRGQRLDTFTESVDIAPTLCEYAGAPVPDRLQGTSLLGLLRGQPSAPARSEVHFEYDFRDKAKRRGEYDPDECLLWVIRDREYKYVQFGVEAMPPLLFDLRADPGEHHDLAHRPEHAATVAWYAQKMLRWRMKNEDQRMEHWAYPYR